MVDLSHRGQPIPRLQPWEPLWDDWVGPNQLPREVDKDPPQAREEVCPHPARAEGLLPLTRVGSHRLPAKAVNQPLQVEAEHQPPQEVLLTHPQADEERVMAPGLTGTRWPCENPEVESLSPRGLPT